MNIHVLDNYRVTVHAQSRMQGRGIRAKAVDLVLRYGTEERAATRRTLVRLDHDARLELEAEYPELREHLAIYIILASGVIVTVCHDTFTHRRHLHG